MGGRGQVGGSWCPLATRVCWAHSLPCARPAAERWVLFVWRGPGQQAAAVALAAQHPALRPGTARSGRWPHRGGRAGSLRPDRGLGPRGDRVTGGSVCGRAPPPPLQPGASGTGARGKVALRTPWTRPRNPLRCPGHAWDDKGRLPRHSSRFRKWKPMAVKALWPEHKGRRGQRSLPSPFGTAAGPSPQSRAPAS